ncbi:hypothetical protein COMA2_40054 [Candidatus Nitrospira nitrificans]|uniref:Uncharacterized protein n=1 Tax=Candidatus Nitrospira nitrificans TaxID=1742973 RepID=A0A0S4LJT0_9BACT|nr:hypothetical protein COMA2_40054 [Candidatus Nitrospira nitrificans]
MEISINQTFPSTPITRVHNLVSLRSLYSENEM